MIPDDRSGASRRPSPYILRGIFDRPGAFVGIVGMFRLHVLDERQRDAESEVRFWLKQLMKRENFVASVADVHVWLLEEQSGVAGPPHQEFLTSALSSNRRWDSGITPNVAAQMWMSAVSGAPFRGWGDIRFAVAPLAIVAGGPLLERRLPGYYLRVPAPLVLLSC